jgi:diacylglycerol kinase family enzyme
MGRKTEDGSWREDEARPSYLSEDEQELKNAVIANPLSGRRIAGHVLPGLLNTLDAKRKVADTWWTEYPGHAQILAATARRGGYERVIAGGGDGTIFDVVTGGIG